MMKRLYNFFIYTVWNNQNALKHKPWDFVLWHQCWCEAFHSGCKTRSEDALEGAGALSIESNVLALHIVALDWLESKVNSNATCTVTAFKCSIYCAYINESVTFCTLTSRIFCCCTFTSLIHTELLTEMDGFSYSPQPVSHLRHCLSLRLDKLPATGYSND